MVGFAAILLTPSGCFPVNAHEIANADHLARETIEALRENGIEGVRPRLKPQTAAAPNLEVEVARMREALPRGKPDSVSLVEGNVSQEHGILLSKLTYRVRGGNAVSRVDVWIEHTGDRRYVQTLRVVPISMR
jgi:hypothetical protein